MQQDSLRFHRGTVASSHARPGRSAPVQPPSRAIEALARKLYEASSPDGISWLRCGWTIREVWLGLALQQQESGAKLFERLFPWRKHHALAVLAMMGLLSLEQRAAAAEPSLFQFEIQAAQHCP